MASQNRIRHTKGEVQRIDGDIVTVRVGKGNGSRDFHVHQNILKSNSPFFTNALKEEWLEAHTRVIELPASDPAIFEIYVQWIYSGRLVAKEPEDDETKLNDYGARIVPELSRLHRLYVLADMLQDDDIRDACLDARLERARLNHETDTSMVYQYYHRSSSQSPYKKLVLDYLVWEVHKSLWSNTLKKGKEDPDFLIDVALKAKEIADGGGLKGTFPYWNDPCKYHLHTEAGRPCYRKKWGLD